MSRDAALILLGLTYVVEALLWAYRKLFPNAGPVFA